MKASRICYLLHLESKKRINLPHGEIIRIGRSPATEIKDVFVSKEQLECVADTETCEVKVKPLGRSICGINGYAIVKDRTYPVSHGHRIELRLGYHEYEIVFEPPPDVKDEAIEQAAKKPKLEFPMFSSSKEIKKDSNFVDSGTWENVYNKELLVYTPESLEARKKIASFDIDGTIIKTKSGDRFPRDGDDWVWYLNEIPGHLRKLHEQDYKVVFFTNQAGLGKDNFKIKDFKRKIENIIKKISVPIQVLIALGKTIYRKPLPGMWNVLIDTKNDNVEIKLEESFYVGDAAGRDKNWAPKRKKDHSCSDRLFALNVGIKFYTPEEYFLKAKPAPFVMPEFDPRNLPATHHPSVDYESPNMILMVGTPGTGKSHFCKKVLIPKGYIHISRDKLGSWQKCVKALEEGLKNGSSCVIDNTNTEKESRARFVEVAKKFKVDCRCFVMDTDFKQSKHNNKFRELTDKSHEPVSDIIINSSKKNYQEPDIAEGFKEVLRIQFVPEFDNEEHEKLYRLFLLEK